jgi:hypothetical protein
MSAKASPRIKTDGLCAFYDPANTRSYPGSGNTTYSIILDRLSGDLVNGVSFSNLNNGVFVFDGTNDTIQFPLPSTINTGSQITISFWAKWNTVGTSTTTIQTLFDNQYQVADNIGFFIQDRPDLGGVLEWSTQPNNTIPRRVYSSSRVGDGNWKYIVGTNDGSFSRLYVDGYETGTAVSSAGIATTQPTIFIGNWGYVYSSPRYLNGSLSEIKIYNIALTASEIYKNYSQTKRRYV